MKATGITAEFDPLHKGHEYLMEEARRLSGCDAVVVAMSGDFVQRGEPALTDKWTRTEAALRSGADLVTEIPVLFCLGNAQQYASASVRLLEAAGCSHIAFGSESGDVEALKRTASFIKRHHGEMTSGIRALTTEGLSYPAARAAVYRQLREKESGLDRSLTDTEVAVMSEPNDILALEYIMRMKTAEPLVIARKGSSYHGGIEEGNGFQSASAIRSFLSENRDREAPLYAMLDEWMSKSSFEALIGSELTFPQEWTEILRYAVMSSDISSIEDCPSGGEGLGNLLSRAVMTENSFEGIIRAVKSKRYTYTRISRLCMQVILGITRTAYPQEDPGYIRVLGFSPKGRELLGELKRRTGGVLPVLSNINREAGILDDEASKLLGLDVHAADIYNLVTGRDCTKYSDHVRRPVMI